MNEKVKESAIYIGLQNLGEKNRLSYKFQNNLLISLKESPLQFNTNRTVI